ncbi:hypothetical protein A5746_29870 [Mycolicibacterium conceptionense]|nr:hypothetical protein A5639_20725 [Mycolicibacterium conceptionense]OMB83541.1 hypothetical protein A5746_29870 [Mycolicibacterium conceptionense]OMB90322.1 hypothetical protein A5741_12130 [Mycolicibacterium conceptionense]
MGGSEDAGAGGDGSAAGSADNGQQQAGNQQQSNNGQQSGGSDKGFPDNTAVKDMTAEQQAAYYRFHNRKAENTLASFKGVTPQQVQEMQTELESLRDKQLTADQKAIKDAEKAARAAADAEWKPKLQTAQLRAIAGEVLKGDELESWMYGRNPAAFANDQGDIDREKVMGHLAPKGGGQNDQQQSNNSGQQRDWGQHSGGSGGAALKPGANGLAAAEKRFGKQQTT